MKCPYLSKGGRTNALTALYISGNPMPRRVEADMRCGPRYIVNIQGTSTWRGLRRLGSSPQTPRISLFAVYPDTVRPWTQPTVPHGRRSYYRIG